MIETSEILDLTEGASSERSDDDQQDDSVVLDSHGVSYGPGGRQTTASVASHIHLQDIADMTPKEEIEANSMLDADFKDVKIGFEELCPVCGDRVSGYHYGLLTCESCKGFFKRTVQNKKTYSCVDSRSCQIDKSQRKRCPYCRFQKCLSVGMKLEAVRSDRMRGGRNKFGPMYKRDRALKQQAARHVMQGSDLPLLANSLLEEEAPDQTEDVKPDPCVLQASLKLYSGAHTTTSTISELISGSNFLSATASVPPPSTTTSVGGHNDNPSPAHTRHFSHTGHQTPHQVLVTVSSQELKQNFGHVPAQPQSPKTYCTQPHRNKQLIKSNSNILEQDNTSPPSCHPQLQQNSFQNRALSNFQTANPHGRVGEHRQTSPCTNNMLMSASQDRESLYPSVIEALRAFQGRVVTAQPERPVLSPLIREIKATMGDESEVKHKMMTFIQNELSHTELNYPEQFLPILCRMVDQLLFLMVEWARNSAFFKEIKVEDQMTLLHNSWSEILILDFIYRQIHHVWGKEIVVPTGEVIGFEILDKLGLGDVKAKLFELIKKGRELKLDFQEYMCLKFIILLSPDVSGLESRAYIEQSQEKVTAALLEYCRVVYPNIGDKYSQLLMRLPEIRLISIRTEDFLYFKHLSNEVPDQTLLTEMLHAKRRG